MSETSADSELDAEVFGPLVSIPEDSLIRLATQIQKEALNTRASSGSLISRIGGSYNIAHIIQLDNESQGPLKLVVTTLRLIKRETMIPVPEVYGFDTTCDNEIGAPYICMSFMPGMQMSKAWFENLGPENLEVRRLRILTSLAQALAQLSKFSFGKIGSLQDTADGLVVVPCYGFRENDDGTMKVVEFGPYATASAYLQDSFAVRDRMSVWCVAENKVMDVVVPCFPSSPDESFVLSIPDFDSQNILVDDEGTVTGIIDWDHVQTLPRCIGYCSYPGWITRDWDPLMYGWPKRTEFENSPEELTRYREHYDREMGKAMRWDGDWVHTRKSHVRESVWIAVFNSMSRLNICKKMVETVMEDQEEGEEGRGEGVEDIDEENDEEADEDSQDKSEEEKSDALGIMYDLGTDYLGDQKWRRLKQRLEALVS